MGTLGFGLYTSGVIESITTQKAKEPSESRLESHTPHKQSNGSKKRTDGRHMHGQTHGGGTKPNFRPQNNKRKKAQQHRDKGRIVN